MRWLVDGMNVIGARPDGWWRDRDAAVRRLAEQLAAYSLETGDAVTVVFDGRAVELPEEAEGEIAALFARRSGPDAADDDIARIVAAAEEPGAYRVATSDDALAERVREHGAQVIGAGAFRRRLDEVAPPD
jgi:predicted RNA-binding protein with PIN domain